ncbi:MAG: DUF1385 domain-containing protein [Oscillospiraceae bacterium]|nr:DUF1385 domain-containing protein [Oscillospiraceae bacterium]
MAKRSKKTTCQEKFKTMIGGQALIEGIMMRGPEKQSIVVRTQDGLAEKVEELHPAKEKCPVWGWPLIRGVVNFFASLIGGVKALMYSADFFPEEEESEPSRFDRWLEKHIGQDKLQKLVVPFAVVLGVAFSVGIFILLPAVVLELLSGVIPNYLVRNLMEGVLRILIFVGYLAAISQMKDMKRVFSYHGAEHKTIRCYEARQELTVENVAGMSRFHPRCGTSFLFVVMVISILVFTVIRVSSPLLRVVLRLLLLPVVVAISYEINRFVGRHDNAFTRVLVKPGLWFQNFTTNEPDDSMIEVAIRALRLVIPEKEGADQW